MLTRYEVTDVPREDLATEQQINVPPDREGGLWKVITTALRCPRCASTRTKAYTGKRRHGRGLTEHYRHCGDCKLRFRVIQE